MMTNDWISPIPAKMKNQPMNRNRKTSPAPMKRVMWADDIPTVATIRPRKASMITQNREPDV